MLDLVGNRLTKLTAKEGGTVERTEGTFDARDRLKEERVYNAATAGTLLDTITFGYDHNGSLTLRQTTSGSKLEQGWDLRNRLSGATASQLESGGWVVQTTASYQYTPDGIRSQVTENGAVTLYTIDGHSPSGYAQVVGERTSAEALVASYVYGAGLDPIIITRPVSGTGVYLGDGHSGVRQVLAPDGGAVLAAYRYDAFGNKAASAGTFANPVGYRGERFDATLGQYYLRARFYDPRTGRFARLDPFRGLFQQPITFHRYAYAALDPIQLIDPSGNLFGYTTGLGAFAKSLTIRTLDFTARIYPTLWMLPFKIQAIMFTVMTWAPLVIGGAVICAAGVDFVSSATIKWLNNTEPISNDIRVRGVQLERISGANLGGNVEAIDDLREGHATSIRTHAVKSPDALVDAIRKDLRELDDIENRTLTGTTHDGRRVVIQPGTIQTKGLLVGIPENHSHYMSPAIRERIRALAESSRAFVRVAPVQNWRR